MHRSPLSQLLPNTIELWYVALTALALILVGDGKLMLQRLGLLSSAHLIGQQVSTKVLWGTSVLDTLRFTASAVNLIVWGATGLVIYSALQALVQALRTFQFERDFDSTRYVHPQGFTHAAYWQQVVLDTILGFILLALLAVGGFIYSGALVPNSFAYVNRFVLAPGAVTALDLLAGLAVAFVGTLAVYMLLKLVIRHHRVTPFKG